MKPPAFEYLAPTTVADAVAELARHDGEARPLAGGQSLIPMLNFRLLAPTMLVDLRRIAELSTLTISPSEMFIGAMTRTARLLEPDVAAACPVLSGAVSNVAHPQIRSRGTIGGSISNADPAAEMPAAAVLAGASMHLAGPDGPRTVAAREYFHGLFTTACEWNEILVGVTFPISPAGSGWGFREYARRPGDFAVAGVGVLTTLQGLSFSSINIVSFGVGGCATLMSATEQACLGRKADLDTIKAARHVFEGQLDADGSPFASADFKRRIAGVLFEQAMNDAILKAGGARIQ